MNKHTTFLFFAAAINCVYVKSQSFPEWVNYFVNEKCAPYHLNAQRQIIIMNMYGCAMNLETLKAEDLQKYFCENCEIDFCANMVVKYFSYCLTDEEKYLPNLFMSSFKESKRRFCEKESHYVEDTYKKLSHLDCIKNNTFGMSLEKCSTDLFEVNDIVPLVFTKSNVCGQIPVFQKCVEKEIKSKCGSELLLDVSNVFFTSFVNQCNIVQNKVCC